MQHKTIIHVYAHTHIMHIHNAHTCVCIQQHKTNIQDDIMHKTNARRVRSYVCMHVCACVCVCACVVARTYWCLHGSANTVTWVARLLPKARPTLTALCSSLQNVSKFDSGQTLVTREHLIDASAADCSACLASGASAMQRSAPASAGAIMTNGPLTNSDSCNRRTNTPPLFLLGM